MVGERLREIRLARQMTQSDVCAEICSRSMLSHIENGDCNPSVQLLEALCERLGIKAADILNAQTAEDDWSAIDDLQEMIAYREFDDAIHLANNILRTKHVQTNSRMRCECLQLLGLAHNYAGQYDEALQAYSLAVESSDACGFDLRVKCINGLAAAMINTNKTKDALTLLVDAYDASRVMLKPNQTMIHLVYNIAKAYRCFGDHENTAKFIRTGLLLSKKTGIFDCAGHLEVLMGLMHLECGRFAQAHESFQRALLLYEYIGDEQSQVGCLVNLAEVYLATREYDKACSTIQSAVRIMKRNHHYGLRSTVRRTLAKVRETKAKLTEL